MMRKYMPFDEVAYIGKKFAGDLHGVKGTVCNRVSGSDHGVVVDFDGDSYLMDERVHLAPFRGLPKQEDAPAAPRKKEDPEITTRRKRKPAAASQEAD